MVSSATLTLRTADRNRFNAALILHVHLARRFRWARVTCRISSGHWTPAKAVNSFTPLRYARRVRGLSRASEPFQLGRHSLRFGLVSAAVGREVGQRLPRQPLVFSWSLEEANEVTLARSSGLAP
jgi:hypothetical protein